MKLLRMICVFIMVFCATIGCSAQDTIRITEKEINTKVLREGTHCYLVYFKMKKDATRTHTQFWTRTIERTKQSERPIITVTQEWEDKDSSSIL